jgi:hypothetical protein
MIFDFVDLFSQYLCRIITSYAIDEFLSKLSESKIWGVLQ